MEEWNDLSREPEDLTKFLTALGIHGCEIEEIYNLDSLEDSKYVYGIILLYSWSPSPIPESLYASPELLTISVLDPKLSLLTSILTILFNSDIDLPPFLQSFKEFITPLPSKLKAVALHNSTELKSTNQAFSKKGQNQMFFTSFLPKSGKIVEINGLSNGPYLLASEIHEEDWVERIKHLLSEKIALFSEHQVDFSIFVMIKNKVLEAEKGIFAADKKIGSIWNKLGERVSNFDQEYLDGLGDDKETLVADLAALEEFKANCEAVVKGEKGKEKNWNGENKRRKHNFVPFIASFLQKLDEKKLLEPLFEQALKKKLLNS